MNKRQIFGFYSKFRFNIYTYYQMICNSYNIKD